MSEEERMFRVATVEERKAGRVRELAEACRRTESRLADYASRHGGRFLLFGSYVKGSLRHDSDLDILVDFPEDPAAAWNFAEKICHQEGVRPDLVDFATASPDFLAKVVPLARVIA
jgi:predicted nucleotidyltransferase